MKKSYLFLLGIFLTVSIYSQKDHKGCHHFRNQGQHKKFSNAEKTMTAISNARSDTFNIHQYDIHLDVTDYSGQTITGFTDITFEPILESQSYINLDLYQLVVDSVTDDNGLLTYTYDDEILKVNFDDVLPAGDITSIRVYYHGSPYRDPSWGGFYFESGYIYNLGIGLTTIPPNFGKVWYPCFDSFVERANYTYHIKSADGYLAHCQGNLVGEDVISGDTIERHFEFLHDITTHQSAIAVSDYQTHSYDHVGEYGTIPVTLKAKPAQFESMDDIFTELGICIDALEYWYGPYPFDKVGYIMTTDGALEIPENIAYPASMTGASLFANGQLFGHELGHQWWGNIVTPRLHNHMWIKEGPAEYSGHLFVEYKDGPEEFIEVVKDNQLFVLEEAHVQDNGFQVLSPIIDEEIYGRHTYYKGASVMHNMRAYLGDELFRQAMMQVQANEAYTSVNAAQFEEVLEDATGADLSDFFQDWILSPGFSTFVVDSVSTTENNGMFTSQVYVQQKLREAPDFHSNVPIELSALSPDWEYTDFQFVADGEFSNFEIETDFEPVLVAFNVHNRLNGARMDYQDTIFWDETFNMNLPRVDFRVKKNGLPDGENALIRLEHIWAGPDDEFTHIAIDDMSDNHYWIVDGDWPEGTDLEARIDYHGVDPYDLDFDLVGQNEADLMLVYRETSADEWINYPDYNLNAGSLTSGTGNIQIEPLRKGQYALANGDVSLTIPALDLAIEEIQLFPNPSTDQINIKMSSRVTKKGQVELEIYDSSGKLCGGQILGAGQASDVITYNTSDLINGNYILLIKDKTGVVDSGNFEVFR